MIRAVIALPLAACLSFSGGSNGGDGDGDGDSDAGGADGQAVDCESWGERRFFDACTHSVHFDAPLSPLVLDQTGTYRIDTTNVTLTSPDSNAIDIGAVVALTDAYGNLVDSHLIVVSEVEIDAAATLEVLGAHPLVIASIGDVVIAGAIDISSGADRRGAGAGLVDDGRCANLDGEDNIDGGSGGGGGGLAFDGGRGGDGRLGASVGASGGASLFTLQSPLSGGCPGGQGGDGDTGAGGLGGSGGGAIVLSAIGNVSIAGLIDAGGEGGKGQIDARRNGGGGGGSGGLIALEGGAVILTSSSTTTANGGGGGGGSNNLVGPSLDGADGRRAPFRAQGGEGEGLGTSPDGGSGGGGGSLTDFVGLSGFAGDRGGGGGGGGAGVILALTTQLDNNGVVSPLVTADSPPYD